MKISVITVCLNAARTIGFTLDSFSRQTHRAKQLLVVDGGSSDGTLDIVRSRQDADITILPRPVSGIFESMNAGLGAAQGDVFGFLNSDDTFHDADALAKVSQGLQAADIVYGDIVMVADHRSKLPMRNWTAGAFDRARLRRGWMPPHPAFYARRRILERVGAFDTAYPKAADYDFMLRALLNEDYAVEYLDAVLVDFGIGGTSTKNLLAIVRGNLECARAMRAQAGLAAAGATLVMKPLSKLAQVQPHALRALLFGRPEDQAGDGNSR